MKIKRMSLEWHTKQGAMLKGIAESVGAAMIEASPAYGVSSREMKALFRFARQISVMRSELDNAVHREHSGEQMHIYYPAEEVKK